MTNDKETVMRGIKGQSKGTESHPADEAVLQTIAKSFHYIYIIKSTKSVAQDIWSEAVTQLLICTSLYFVCIFFLHQIESTMIIKQFKENPENFDCFQRQYYMCLLPCPYERKRK